MTAQLDFFHAIADAPSARVRRYICEHQLTAIVQFRNITYPEVMAELIALGGHHAPALWDGARMHSGADAIIAQLEAFRR